jgi:leader peptidase (prepilin peptidase)/N-methyltransferase
VGVVSPETEAALASGELAEEEVGDDTLTAAPAPAPLLRHPLLTALAALAVAVFTLAAYPGGPDGVIAAATGAVLIVLAATDIERRIVPNVVVLPATFLVLVSRIAFFPSHWYAYVLGALGAGAAFMLPNLLSRSAIGMGDVKLAIFLGAGLGAGVIGAVMVAWLSVFPFAVAMLVRGGLAARKASLPFAPFLAFGALVILILPRLVGLGGS